MGSLEGLKEDGGPYGNSRRGRHKPYILLVDC